MHRFPRRAVAATLLVVLLAACSSDGQSGSSREPAATSTDQPSRSRLPSVSAPPSEAVVGEVPATILDAILADAAERAGVDADAIEVTTAEQVNWPDGSLGCPDPGQVYTQAIVEGYWVVLRAGDERLDYRVGNGGTFRFCERGGVPIGD
jgi:hypothetical protein